MIRIKNLIYNNWFLATVLSLPFFYLFNSVSKYKIEEIASAKLNDNFIVYYNDLDGNGTSEKILFNINSVGNLCLKIFNPGHQGQFNSNCKKPVTSTQAIFGDINNDGVNEVLFLGERDSAVYLNVLDYGTRKLSEYMVDKVPATGTADYVAKINHIYDMDLDGTNDVIICIAAFECLQPRALYLLNPEDGTFLKTTFQGSVLSTNALAELIYNLLIQSSTPLAVTVRLSEVEV